MLNKNRPDYSCTSKDLKLHRYQTSVAKHLLKNPNQNGIVVDYGTGTGKTLVGVNVAETLRRHKMVNHIVVVTPASLLGNFALNVRKCLSISPKNVIPSYYHIYSYEGFEKVQIKESWKPYAMIIDEAHNLRNSNAKRVKSIFNAARLAKKVILLTATPFINQGSDISILLNMFLEEEKYKNFPLDPKEFDKMYKEKPDYLRANLQDLVAYYKADESTLPKVVYHENKVYLSDEQDQAIKAIRENSLSEKLAAALDINLKKGDDLGFQGKDRMRINAFLTRVRQASNHIPGNGFSPKVQSLVNKAMSGPKPVLIYSEYIGSGVNAVADCLKSKGVSPNEIVIFNGSLTKPKRDALVERYNAASGPDKINYLLFTEAGSEGISLKHTRQIHILEPYWNMSRIKQVVGRGVRLDSHTDLPLKERQVDVNIWFGVSKNSSDSLSSPDVRLYENIAKTKQIKLDKYERSLKEASIQMDDGKDDEKEEEEDEDALITLEEDDEEDEEENDSDDEGDDSDDDSDDEEENDSDDEGDDSDDDTVIDDEDVPIVKKPSPKKPSPKKPSPKKPSPKKPSSPQNKDSDNESDNDTEIDEETDDEYESKKPAPKKKMKPKKKPVLKKKVSPKKPSSCAGQTPPCPKTCSAVKASRYKRNGKVINRRAYCRSKSRKN
jgi:superfamily II DNA or RNA helicase